MTPKEARNGIAHQPVKSIPFPTLFRARMGTSRNRRRADSGAFIHFQAGSLASCVTARLLPFGSSLCQYRIHNVDCI
jgi:hypothetical protein